MLGEITDELADDYPVTLRAFALLGLLVLAGLAYVFADVLTGGKLTGGCGCTHDEQEAPDAGD